VESSPSACDDFGVNLDAYDHVSLYEAPAALALEHLAAQGFRPDVAVLDPPRSGLSRAALDGLMALAPPVIAYVSCDPATLARDGRRMARRGYRLAQMTPFDMFPQTYHIETVSVWARHKP
jgi:23S rRNA (uracil1939-C5)-methyltransferase